MRPIAATLLLLTAVLAPVFSQTVQQTCPTSLPSECYFTGAATLPPGTDIPNQYYVIGGMFDVHMKGVDAYTCNQTVDQAGILQLEAFFWAINRYKGTSRPINVGAVAFDNCMRPEQTIENIMGYAQCKTNIQAMNKGNLVAYVGPYSNQDARMTGRIAADLGLTLVSPTANAMDLNYMEQISLLRLSPSFMYDLKAIAKVLDEVNSEFVMILYSGSDPFWMAAYNAMMEMITMENTRRKLCMRFVSDIDSTMMNVTMDGLMKNRFAKYIVPLMSLDRLAPIMRSLSGEASLVFILNSMIGQNLNLLTSANFLGNNTIVLDYMRQSSRDYDDFKVHIKNIRENNELAKNSSWSNPWLGEYLMKQNLPDLDSVQIPSPLTYSLMKTLTAVDLIVKGMNSVIQDCGSNQFCDRFRNQRAKADDLFAKFKASSSMFNPATMNSQIKYTLYNFHIASSNGGAVFDTVGDVSFNDNGDAIVNWIKQLKNYYGATFDPPVCPVNEVCCTTTTTTSTTTSAPTQATGSGNGVTSVTPGEFTMVRYPRSQAITGAYSSMSRMDSEYGTRFDLGHKWIIALGVLAGLGILCVFVFEIYILYKLLGTRVGSKWRTMWLGQLLLFGLFLCYLTLFAYLPIPTKATCGITRFGVGVSYAFCFAVLLVKLMVILTSKSSDVLLPGDGESPNYLKGIYQFLMFIFAVGVQIVIDVQWLITVPPEAVMVTANNGERVWVCNHYTWEAGKEMDLMSAFVRTNFENHLMSLIYIMIMILITTILSLNAHGIITNHRESVFIGIAAGFSIPIWLAWGLVGGLNRDHDFAHEFGDACIAFGLLLTATLILFAMFLPKVRQLVNMGVEGIYLEDDRDTYYAGSVIMAPASFKSKGANSVIYVNNQGIYSEPVVIGNGDPSKEGVATHLKHPGSVFSTHSYQKRPESNYGGSTRVLRVTDDLRGRHPQKPRPQSEIAYGSSGRPRSVKGTLPRSRSQTNLGAL